MYAPRIMSRLHVSKLRLGPVSRVRRCGPSSRTSCFAPEQAPQPHLRTVEHQGHAKGLLSEQGGAKEQNRDAWSRHGEKKQPHEAKQKADCNCGTAIEAAARRGALQAIQVAEPPARAALRKSVEHPA